MIEGMPLTWDYIKNKYEYLWTKALAEYEATHLSLNMCYKRKILTVKLNGELQLLEIHTIRGISLLEFGNPRTVIHTFEPVKPSSRITPQIEFFDDLKLIQISNGPEDPEEIEFDKQYQLSNKYKDSNSYEVLNFRGLNKKE